MGSRDIDNLKEVSCKLRKVSCNAEKLVISSYLI